MTTLNAMTTRRGLLAGLGVVGLGLGLGAGFGGGRRSSAAFLTVTPNSSENTPAASPEATPGALIDHPTGADDLVLRIAFTGGFVPIEYTLTEMPGFSLYGDGSLVTLGPQIEIFPPPALPNLRLTRLSEAGVQTVLARAEAAGLLDGDASYGNNMVADAATTVFTVNARGEHFVVSAYALGFGGDDPEHTPEIKEALAKLIRFVEEMGALSMSLPAEAIIEADADYVPERFRVIAVAADAMATPEPTDPVLEQEPKPWPLTTPLSAFGESIDFPALAGEVRCGEVSGEDAATLYAALLGANTLTPWISEGATYRAYIRPLLPDESGCQPLG